MRNFAAQLLFTVFVTAFVAVVVVGASGVAFGLSLAFCLPVWRPLQLHRKVAVAWAAAAA